MNHTQQVTLLIRMEISLWGVGGPITRARPSASAPWRCVARAFACVWRSGVQGGIHWPGEYSPVVRIFPAGGATHHHISATPCCLETKRTEFCSSFSPQQYIYRVGQK